MTPAPPGDRAAGPPPAIAVDAWPDGDGAAFGVKVNPGARRDRVGGAFDGRLRVAVTAAPEKGKANRAVLALLAKALAVPATSLVVLAGETDPRKRVGARGLPVDECARRVARLAADES